MAVKLYIMQMCVGVLIFSYLFAFSIEWNGQMVQFCMKIMLNYKILCMEIGRYATWSSHIMLSLEHWDFLNSSFGNIVVPSHSASSTTFDYYTIIISFHSVMPYFSVLFNGKISISLSLNDVKWISAMVELYFAWWSGVEALHVCWQRARGDFCVLNLGVLKYEFLSI